MEIIAQTMSSLSGWVHYNRGWTRRVMALAMLRLD